MPQQERPSSPVPETYAPPTGTRHRVATGETWASLAQPLGIGAWDLIDFNFPGTKQTVLIDGQLATRQVNWYLSQYVGCTVPSGENWAFSSGLTSGKGGWKGGFIYLPPASAPAPPPPPTAPTPPASCLRAGPLPSEWRRPTFYRALNIPELTLAAEVFGRSLPHWTEIGIGDGLGAGGTAWTLSGPTDYDQMPNMNYQINIGDLARLDLTNSTWQANCFVNTDGTVSDVFIHELTHVWQYHNGFPVMLHSVYAQKFGAGYDFTEGDPWDDYNVEQQAHIVEKWHHNGRHKADVLYPYVRLVVWSGGNSYARSLDLAKLKADADDLIRRHMEDKP